MATIASLAEKVRNWEPPKGEFLEKEVPPSPCETSSDEESVESQEERSSKKDEHVVMRLYLNLRRRQRQEKASEDKRDQAAVQCRRAKVARSSSKNLKESLLRNNARNLAQEYSEKLAKRVKGSFMRLCQGAPEPFSSPKVGARGGYHPHTNPRKANVFATGSSKNPSRRYTHRRRSQGPSGSDLD